MRHETRARMRFEPSPSTASQYDFPTFQVNAGASSTLSVFVSLADRIVRKLRAAQRLTGRRRAPP